MLASAIPAKMPTPFGVNATDIRTIPATTTVFGEASYQYGFPHETTVNPSAGGIPPDGRDFNGIFNAISAWCQWVQAGGAPVAYDSAFQTTIGGYPNGAVVASTTFVGTWWRSTADNNTDNPDAGTSTKWVNAFPSANGQCQISFVSATQIALKGKNGNNVIVQGATMKLASSVTAANTSVLVNGVTGSLAASTAYLVSLYWNGSALALAFWAVGTYGHAPDTNAINVGTEVITSGGTPNTLHSLVGMVLTNSSAQFQANTSNTLAIKNWFGQQDLGMKTGVSSLAVAPPNTMTEISATLRITALAWASEIPKGQIDGTIQNNGSNFSALQAFIDGISSTGSFSQENYVGPSTYISMSSSYGTDALTEGSHVFSPYNSCDIGSVIYNQLYNKVYLKG